MSNLKVSLYRTLTQDLISLSGIASGDYSFTYTDQTGNSKLITKKDSSEQNSVEIPGKGSQWEPAENNLIIKRRYSILNPNILFDISEGIAGEDAELGMALVILSRDSSQRRAIPYTGVIKKQNQECILDLNAVLPAQQYRKSLQLRTIMYLKKRSVSDIHPFFGNTEGFVFGILSETKLFIEEQSPEFPTRTVKLGPKEPLWKLELNWTDPRVDKLIDTVRVIINESYPGYNEIWGPNADEKKKQALKIEIYSSAMVMMIEKVRESSEYWEDTLNGNLESIEDESISDYLYYLFNQVLGESPRDTNSISLMIRKKLGERE